MESAQSQVQQMRYQATFPLLLNIADQPTYFMALKGEDGLVKMYAMVNVQQYQLVETGQTVAECETEYRQALAHAGLISAGEASVEGQSREEHGVVAEIRTAVINGNTHCYIRMEHTPGYATGYFAGQGRQYSVYLCAVRRGIPGERHREGHRLPV